MGGGRSGREWGTFTLSLALTLKRRGIEEVIAIFWIINDPHGLLGLKDGNEERQPFSGP